MECESCSVSRPDPAPEARQKLAQSVRTRSGICKSSERRRRDTCLFSRAYARLSRFCVAASLAPGKPGTTQRYRHHATHSSDVRPLLLCPVFSPFRSSAGGAQKLAQSARTGSLVHNCSERRRRDTSRFCRAHRRAFPPHMNRAIAFESAYIHKCDASCCWFTRSGG